MGISNVSHIKRIRKEVNHFTSEITIQSITSRLDLMGVSWGKLSTVHLVLRLCQSTAHL